VKYRHRYHAGNFADVHKHVALLALLQSLQQKERGLLYLETHAGAGAYDLAAPTGRHGAEARHGVMALLQAPAPSSPALIDYCEAVRGWRSRIGAAHTYPGSPLLLGQALRSQDRGVFYELLPTECRALERALASSGGGGRRLRTHCADGYAGVAANLPPVERRALILIDPPYEQPAEVEQALRAIDEILGRLANAVIALWYPIKDERWLAGWQGRAASRLSVPATTLELWLYPRDARVALNGSGLMIINPPYQFDSAARLWQAELRSILEQERPGGATSSGDAVHKLLGEQEGRHESA
jgi:23S rRNA (adenine2030-N6)-methyltransferase